MTKKYKIIRLICLILFILSSVILLVEACTPGPASASKSNVISDSIAGVINNISEAVSKKPRITNLDEFRYFIRKLLGHYGAFLILGIFAALSCMLYYAKVEWKIYWIKVLIILIYGFSFAGITELIQVLTPGRAGVMTDVFIDFSGYITSVLIILITFYVIYMKKINKRSNILS